MKLDSLAAAGAVATTAMAPYAASVTVDDVTSMGHILIGIATLVMQFIAIFKKKKPVV